MKYYICPKCMNAFKFFKKKKNVHCDVKSIKVDKKEYKRVHTYKHQEKS